MRIKTFVGTSANALKTQVWAALIAMLLIKYPQLMATFGWSLSNLVALLGQQLFVYRDLGAWIDHRFQVPELPEAPSEQRARPWPNWRFQEAISTASLSRAHCRATQPALCKAGEGGLCSPFSAAVSRVLS